MRRGLGVFVALAVAGLLAVIPFGTAHAAAPFKLPYPAGSAYTITQTPGGGFSHGDEYNWHAVDFGMPTGTPVVASAAGTVYYNGWNGPGGNMLLIDHGGNRCSQYAHLNATSVAVGAQVAQGQQIATSGATGNVTGPHLHWNIVYCDSMLSREIANTVETGTDYPTGFAPVSQNSLEKPDLERVSDFNGDGKSDVLGVDADGDFWFYANTGSKLAARKQIGHGWGEFLHVMSADWSGDGTADVLGVDGDGKLWYYPNNGHKLSPRVQLGHGWGDFLHVMSADWSGDGKADVLGVDANGDLWYYAHNGNKLSQPVKMGHNWGGFLHVTAADWSGDGKADVLGVDANGDLWYYAHNGTSLSQPVKKGHAWGDFAHVFASDFSGDGKADVLGVDENGDLWYYPHNGTGLSKPVKIGHGWSEFTSVL